MMFDANSGGARFLLQNPLPPGAYSALDDGNEIDEPARVQQRHRGRRRPREDEAEEDNEGDGAIVASVPANDEPIFKPIPCDDITEVRDELGKPGKPLPHV